MPNSFRRVLLTRAARLFDLALVSLTFVAAFAVSFGSFSWPTLAELLVVRIKVVNILVFGAYLAVCSAIFSTCGFYLSHRLSDWTRPVREILIATTLITGVIFVLPLRMAFATIQFFVIFWLLTVTVLVLSRVVGYLILSYVRSRGRNLRNLVIIGEGLDAIALAHRIERDAALGYRVLRIINTKSK